MPVDRQEAITQLYALMGEIFSPRNTDIYVIYHYTSRETLEKKYVPHILFYIIFLVLNLLFTFIQTNNIAQDSFGA